MLEREPSSPGVCDLFARCASRNVWRKAGEAMEAALEATTLQDLVQDHRALEAHALSYAI